MSEEKDVEAALNILEHGDGELSFVQGKAIASEVRRLRELAQGPATNWAKVKDAQERANAAERCSGKWMKDRDRAMESMTRANVERDRASQEAEEAKRFAAMLESERDSEKARADAAANRVKGLDEMWQRAKTHVADLRAKLSSLTEEFDPGWNMVSAYKDEVRKREKVEKELQSLGNEIQLRANKLAEKALKDAAEAKLDRDHWAAIFEYQVRSEQSTPAWSLFKNSAEKANSKADALAGALRDYEQALKDHARDGCQCKGPCRGDCGPALARKLLALLELSPAKPEPAPEPEENP